MRSSGHSARGSRRSAGPTAQTSAGARCLLSGSSMGRGGAGTHVPHQWEGCCAGCPSVSWPQASRQPWGTWPRHALLPCSIAPAQRRPHREAVPPHRPLRCQHHRGGAVSDRARIARCDGAALGAEEGLQLAQLVGVHLLERLVLRGFLRGRARRRAGTKNHSCLWGRDCAMQEIGEGGGGRGGAAGVPRSALLQWRCTAQRAGSAAFPCSVQRVLPQQFLWTKAVHARAGPGVR